MADFANGLAGLSAFAAGVLTLANQPEAAGTALVLFGLVYAAKTLGK